MASPKKKPKNWAAISGLWDFRGLKVEYLGPDDDQTPCGIALTPSRVRSGHVSVKLRFKDFDKHAGRILLGYNTTTGGYYSIGLGGYGYAYVVDEFVPGKGWRGVVTKGSKSQILNDKTYYIKVEIRGQTVSLTVDDIRILDCTLPQPLSGSQTGLFAWGPGTISFEDLEWSGDNPQVFVVMQFSEPYDSIYEKVILPTCKKNGFEVLRADDVFKPGIILQDIIQALIESDVIIAEITPSNPNVFYELGYAHALDKPTILLANRESKLPFDISGYRVIFYDDSIRGKPEVEKTLEKHLKNILISGR